MNSSTKSRSDVIVPLTPKEAKDLVPALLQIVERLKVTTVVESPVEAEQFDSKKLEQSIAELAEKVNSLSFSVVKSKYSSFIGTDVGGSPLLQTGSGEDTRYVDVVLPTAVNPDKCLVQIAGGIWFSGASQFDMMPNSALTKAAFSPYGDLGAGSSRRQYYFADFTYRFINSTTLRLSLFMASVSSTDSYRYACRVTVLEFA